MAELDPSKLVCSNCDNEGLYADDDGHFYCTNCNSQAEDIIDRANADEDFIQTQQGGAALYSAAHKRHVPAPSATQLYREQVGPTQPADFGKTPRGVVFKEEDYYNAIRTRYVLGLQLMIQLQCEALVNDFGVSPLICGIAGPVWLRFVHSTRVLDDDWPDTIVLESERGEKRYQSGSHFVNEPRNLLNERMVIIWCRSLKKTIPLSYSLAVSYLACHIAKEPVLPNDIIKWAMEGKLPYFGAFPKIAESIKEIERFNQHVSVICPVTASSMFRPSELPLQKLESLAASIAQTVGLSLPPVNFYGIASRYLKQLSLPVEKIIPYACRIHEWSMPPDLWLSANEIKLPSRVCVMSILIVAIRILYNLNGFGKWEGTLSTTTGSSSMDDEAGRSDESDAERGDEEVSKSLDEEPVSVHKLESDSIEFLRNLEKRYDDLSDKFEYSKDLPTYLRYCKDVIFAGSEPLYKDPTLIEELWEFYEKNREDIATSGEFQPGTNQKRSRDNERLFSTVSKDSKKRRDEENTTSCSTDSRFQYHNNSPEWDSDPDNTPQTSQSCQQTTTTDKGEASSQTLEDMTLKYLKIDMDEHRFHYIPPRVDIKRYDYLHYGRKKGDNYLSYVAHADYYILLRACAKIAQVDTRVMHIGVLSLERRLAWIEKWIDRSLLEKDSNETVQCENELDGESVNLSNLNI
ncbi:TATA box-binding protein-associated factor RNA polymerase I subunit B [Beta vulgaris subsp. vulgaris]|uniref:TATA box-binding protein-associated factor RNA polymerase I subunit B n=1 Tax=Beta vulgaris subsp. vulgaris TaxID=3555 RepID=UPI002036B1A9|nr:TATA box-binding protein-associated factor RNA polymerase I subunit B [Beta vulgaris subsp. vulgaris]